MALAVPSGAGAGAGPGPNAGMGAVRGIAHRRSRWSLVYSEFSYWMLRYRRTWRSSVVMGFVNPLLFFAGIGIGLGRIIDRNPAAPQPGGSYLAFLAPGLLAAAAMQTAAIESAFAAYRSLRMQRNYRTSAAGPLEPVDILNGHLLFVVFRVGTAAGTFFLVGACADLYRSPWALLAPFAALLTGLAFAAPFLAWGVFVTKRSSIGNLYRFLVMPLYLFSGTYAAVGQFPESIRILAYATPLWHGVQLCRGLTLGTLTPAAAALHVGYLVAVAASGYVLARAAYARGLHD